MRMYIYIYIYIRICIYIYIILFVDVFYCFACNGTSFMFMPFWTHMQASTQCTCDCPFV